MAKILGNQASYRFLTMSVRNPLEPGDRDCIGFAFLDTGADKNTIFKDAAHRLGPGLDIDDTDRPTFNMYTGDQKIQALGKVYLHFFLKERGKWYKDYFYILPLETTFDVLLGHQFLKREKVLEYCTPFPMKVKNVMPSFQRRR